MAAPESPLEEIVKELLEHLDKNPHRQGLQATPRRHAQFLKEFLETKSFRTTVFDSDGYDEMVIQADIPFYSLCEHHLIPFFGKGTIAYIPDKKIVGLSKLARALEHFSRRLQNQERLTMQVADFLTDAISPKGVGVVLSARHLCMEMRGVRKPGTHTTTSCLRGNFKSRPETREEFMHLVQRKV